MKVHIGFPETSGRTSSLDDPLVVHRRDEKQSAGTLVIFVHGLGGDRYQTWGEFPRFLLTDIEDADIGLYAYRTVLSRFRFAASIELESESGSVQFFV